MQGSTAIRNLFWLAVAVTLLVLLAPAGAVLAAKIWLASWLPFATIIDAMDATTQADKLVHAGLFALLGWLAMRVWRKPAQRRRVVIGLLLLALLTEWLQNFIPGRGASLGDLAADVLGLGAGLLLRPPPARVSSRSRQPD